MDDFILLLIGLVILWLGTELVVNNAIQLARELNWSELFIGLTILAFGTDLPELVVAIDGAIHMAHGADSSGVITGNVIGSSICQISIVLGMTAMFRYVFLGAVQIRYMAIELIGSIILLSLVSIDGIITWNDGALLIIAFAIYFFTHIQREYSGEHRVEKKGRNTRKIPYRQLLLIILGLGGVAFGSDLAVNHALNLAGIWGVRQSFIGAVIIGLGTSLPELAVSIKSVLKNQPGLSLGNIIGSNMFDLLIPLGVGSLIATINIPASMIWFDLPVLLGITAVVLWFLVWKRGIQKPEGIGLVMLYLAYAIVKFTIS